MGKRRLRGGGDIQGGSLAEISDDAPSVSVWIKLENPSLGRKKNLDSRNTEDDLWR